MEKLVAKIEALLPPDSKEPAANLSPAEMLARQWREALAANTMGAAAARQADDARHRATEQEVRSAQSAWLRLGPLDHRDAQAAAGTLRSRVPAVLRAETPPHGAGVTSTFSYEVHEVHKSRP